MKGTFENTFQNGLSSDYQVVYQPDGTYRYMRNCQLISQDGNNLAVKDCLGNVLTFTINAPYSGVYTATGNFPRILAMISFPDKLIVFSTNSISGGYMEIGRLMYLPYGEGVQPQNVSGQYNVGYVPLYHSIDLNGSQQHKIKGFSYIENELIERVYWTDNFNEPRTFNVSDPVFTNYFVTGSLVIGQRYMVLQGAITHNGTQYGPGISAGNVFTAISANYTSLTSPTPKVIEYFPYQLLDFTPSRSLGNITFNKYGTGNLYCGSKVYFYRLGTNSGVVTSWSYGSSPVPVGALNEPYALTSPTVAYHDFVGGGTENTLLNSNLSVYVDIDNIDINFDYIELACAEYDQLINQPRQITIVLRETITGSAMTFQHTGNTSLAVLTIGDITLFPASILRVKTLATNKNFMLAGNITEREEFEINLKDVSQGGTVNANAINYPMNVHYDATSCTLSGMVYSGVSPLTSVNPSGGSVTPFSRWKVTTGTAIYNGNFYNVGDVITGVTGVGNDSIDVTTTPGTQIRPCVTKNRYTNVLTSKRVENSVELQGINPSNTCFWDYKSAAAAHHVTGYWSGETYRFGVLLYDLKGNPYYVKWLADYTFPIINTKGGLIRRDQIGNTGNYIYSLNPTGINFTGITIPPSIIDQIRGFSIVRAERDGKIVSQGLVTQCVHTGASPDVIRPAAWNPPTLSDLSLKEKSYSFICPDLLVNVPLKKPIGVVGDTMQEASWIESFDYGSSIYVRGAGSVAASEQVYSKFLTSLTGGGAARSGVISQFASSVDESEVIQVGGGVTFENGNLKTAAASVDVIGACVSVAADYSLNGYEATAGKKAFFQLNSDFLGYSSGLDYTSGTGADFPQKILMNYTKTGFSNPYGGSGDEAKANTLYISTGHFQPITADVKTQTFDGTNHVFNDIEIFGGDCFVNLIDYGYSLWDNTFPSTNSFAWTFPCENTANYDLRRGRKTSNVEMYYTGTVLTNSIVYLGPSGESSLEDFSYNQGYSTEGQSVVYPALPVDFINSSQFIARIRYAGPKFSGESVDSFRTFAITDFKDLSYNYGAIYDINVKNDKVIIWQPNAICTVPILERQVVGGLSGDATAIGTGGVVDRFDVISSFFGTQHQWSITETEYGFAWFDMRRKAFVILDFNGGLLEVSQVYGLKAFFDEAFVEIEGSTSSFADRLLNSPTFEDTSDRPITGIGIISVYDPKFKMTYMTFKFFGQISTGEKSKDFTIGYLHTDTKKCFVGFFDWNAYHLYNHNGIVLSANDPKNNTQYLTLVPTGKSFVVGETLWGSNSNKQNEYICILNVTLDSAAKFPEGGSGTTYWALVNTVRQIWVNNQPINLTDAVAPNYQYNKFFGKVVNNEIHIVVNPKMQDDESMEVQHISQNGPYNVNYTSVFTEADGIIASDVNISAVSRFYRFIRNKIVSTPPLSTDGRVTNRYTLFKFIKKNWTTNPTVVTTGVKILRSLTSIFNTKK